MKVSNFAKVGISAVVLVSIIAGSTDGGQFLQLPWIRRQDGTPGVQQNGHANISGTMIAGLFQGNGSSLLDLNWNSISNVPSDIADGDQGLVLPFESRGDFGGPAIEIINEATGTLSTALYGQSTSATGRGLWGVGSIGVLGESGMPGGWGVSGVAHQSAGVGMRGESLAPDGTGVFGFGSIGVRGASGAQGGAAIFGEASFATGTSYGVYGQSNSTRGVGVLGLAGGSFDSVGVQGSSHGEVGYGVLGSANSTTGAPYGVFGQAPENGYAVWAMGRFGASGTKSFRIDHPLDPENSFLAHYCTEGPEPRNTYQGSVVTDERGYQWVELPDYFEAINRDPLIQLTVVDDSEDFVLVKVTKRVRGNTFQIRTSKPLIEVCWRVDAVRNDAWVREYGAPTETAKSISERGKYLHPELYSKPSELGMDYARRLER